MKNKISALTLILIALTLPSVVFANDKSFTSRPEKGIIYIIVRNHSTLGPQSTQLSVNWGNYNRSSTINPPLKLLLPGSGVPEGFVIKLRHSKKDSVELKASSNGYILNIYQGDEPDECSQREWKCVSW